MAVLELDTIDAFQGVTLSSNGGSRVPRGFWLKDIDTSTDAFAIASYVKDFPGMPGLGSACLDPGFPQLLATSIVIDAVAGNAVHGAIVFTDSNLGFTPTVYLVTRTRRMVQHTETVLPNGEILWCTFNDSSGKTVAKSLVPISVARPSPVVVIEGLKVGAPDDSAGDYHGYVNGDSYLGKDPGQLRLDDYTTTWSKYSGYSQFRCEVVGNILGRDWSVYGILYNSLVGKYVEVNQGDVMSAASDPYVYGTIGSTDGLGFLHVGPYPTVSFNSIGLPIP